MTTSEQINEIAAACAFAQVALRPALKDATNPAFKSKYADLASILEASRVYAGHGIAVLQDVTSSEAGVAVVTRLAHKSGQWIEFGPLTVPMQKKDAHGLGSATTYAKRYALQAALQIAADEDDDGNAATTPQPSRPTAVAKPVFKGEPDETAPAAPKGYSDWLDDLHAVADTGTPALLEMWRTSSKDFRKHLTDTALSTWDAIKAKADAKTPKAKVSA
jgi:hypothetical protein